MENRLAGLPHYPGRTVDLPQLLWYLSPSIVLKRKRFAVDLTVSLAHPQ
jgi:hypothetical protein